MNPQIIVPPAVELISLAQARQQVRLESDYHDEDDYLEGKIRAAREWSETFCHRTWITSTLKQTIDRWPGCDYIPLPRGPVQSIGSVVYTTAAGVATTWAAANYFLDDSKTPARLYLADNSSWPSGDLRRAAAIAVTYVAGGDTAADVPQRAAEAMLLKIEAWYRNRGDEIMGVNVVPTKLQNSAEALLGPLVVWS